MSEVQERVARAIQAASRRVGRSCTDTQASAMARAAIEAMPVVATVREMFDEYMKDECCDPVKINALLERAASEIGYTEALAETP